MLFPEGTLTEKWAPDLCNFPLHSLSVKRPGEEPGALSAGPRSATD